MKQEQSDLVQEAAWSWVRREHDIDTFDEAARAEMVAWLVADPAHRKAYERAARLWLLAGLIPPSEYLDGWDDGRDEGAA